MPKSTSLDLRELTEPFNAWCARRKVSRSLAIRQLVKAALAEDPQLTLLESVSAPPPPDEWEGLAHSGETAPYRLTLRVTVSQRDFLKTRAAAAGISCSCYVLAAITARDSGANAIAGQDAVQALVRSNDLLARAALSLSAWSRSRATNDTEMVAEIKAVLHEHLARAAMIVSQVEATRIGRPPRRAVKARPANASAGRRRRRPGALG